MASESGKDRSLKFFNSFVLYKPIPIKHKRGHTTFTSESTSDLVKDNQQSGIGETNHSNLINSVESVIDAEVLHYDIIHCEFLGN